MGDWIELEQSVTVQEGANSTPEFDQQSYFEVQDWLAKTQEKLRETSVGKQWEEWVDAECGLRTYNGGPIDADFKHSDFYLRD